MGRNFCEVCGKETFSSRSEAMKAINNMNRRSGRTGSVYQCGYCHGWHVTSYSYVNGKRARTKFAKGDKKQR